MTESGHNPDRAPEGTPHQEALERRLVFQELAQGQKEIEIEHHGQVYRLRLTRNDKLILSK